MGDAIVSVGARGPLGLSSLQLAMCVRARKFEPRACHLVDKRNKPVGMCLTGGLPAELTGCDRLVALGAPALREAMVGIDPSSLPLVLAVPEPGRPDDDERLDGSLVAELARASGADLDVDGSSTVRVGHAGCAYALERARALLDGGAVGVVVGGVDSYFHPDVARWLDEGYRLHAPGAEDGIVPSEGAAFLVLERPAAARRKSLGPQPLAQITDVLTGEERTVLEDEPNTAATMTRLLRVVVEAHGKLEWLLSDVNGERHRVREWQLCSMRQMRAENAVEHRLVDDLGDVGAASGTSMVALACMWWLTGCAPRTACTIGLHAEEAERGVIRLEQPEDSSPEEVGP